jgi:hypothetical protein
MSYDKSSNGDEQFSLNDLIIMIAARDGNHAPFHTLLPLDFLI